MIKLVLLCVFVAVGFASPQFGQQYRRQTKPFQPQYGQSRFGQQQPQFGQQQPQFGQQQPQFRQQQPQFGQQQPQFGQQRRAPQQQYAQKPQYVQQPQKPLLRQSLGGDPRLASILQLVSEIYPDGRYHYAYETENGISAEEGGEQKPAGNYIGNNAQGNYKYTSPEGVPVHIEYTADENGYHPSGDLLPTPPPIPEPILRSIEYINANPHATSNTRNFNRYA